MILKGNNVPLEKAIQRVAVTEKYRPVFEEKAKENLKIPTGGKNSMTLQNSAKSKKKKLIRQKNLQN